MGQTASADAQPIERTMTNEGLSKLFTQQCVRGLQPIELMTLKTNLERVGKHLRSTETPEDVITPTELQTLLSLPEDLPHVTHLIHSFVSLLGQFPLLGHSVQPLTPQGLVKALTLLSKERSSKLFKGDFDYVRLLFAVLAKHSHTTATPHSSPDTQTVFQRPQGDIIWGEVSSIKSMDGMHLEEMSIHADELLELVTFLLCVNRLQPAESLKRYNLDKFEEYRKHAMPILKAMNPDVTQQNVKNITVSLEQFSSVIRTVTPYLLNPLSSLLECLLFDQATLQSTPHAIDERHQSRLIDEFTLSQLSTYFNRGLVYSNIRKLYVGRDSGFSMRSFESKAFKWNAPSLLLLKGSRVTHSRATNPRYRKFEEVYPRTPPSAGITPQETDDTVTYVVYVDQPWRVSNKETFGNDRTVIVQLSPVQRVFTASLTARHFVYFSTLGGGIGVGSQLPTIKGGNTLVRYNPGNVSLTVDSALEIAVFRNLGVGGEFKSVREGDEPFEDRFLISDVEVWGCGGEKELEEQNKRWEWEQAEAKRRQNINLKSMGEDRALLEMAGLIGQHQSGGSV